MGFEVEIFSIDAFCDVFLSQILNSLVGSTSFWSEPFLQLNFNVKMGVGLFLAGLVSGCFSGLELEKRLDKQFSLQTRMLLN